MRAMLVMLSILVGGASIDAAAADTCTAPSCQAFLPLEDGKGVLVYRSHDLETSAPSVRHLVVVVHGSGRNAYHVFNNVIVGATDLGLLDRTLVIAPFFKTAEDSPGPDDLHWTDGGWKRGDRSEVAGISSFEVVDRIVQSVLDRDVFPALELVTVTGHSAGGQFTQRYAAGNGLQADYPDLKFNYVVLNPSSYMYLNEYRPVGGDFEIPTGCADYDEYKYGLIDRNAYMRRLPAPELVAQYVARHVTYLVGGEDTSRTNNLDTSCAGDAQGATRLARGLAYAAYIERFFPANDHAGAVVAGVGHDSYDMANSAAGRAAIFVDPEAIDPPDVAKPMPPTQLTAQ